MVTIVYLLSQAGRSRHKGDNKLKTYSIKRIICNGKKTKRFSKNSI